jgi:aspartokinase
LADDLLRAFADTLAKRNIQPLITSVSASNVVLALDSRDLRHGGRDLIEAVSEFGSATAEPGRAIVSMVGDGVRSEPSIISRALKAIEDTEVVLILHGSSPITMSFVVAEHEVENVVARLHDVFFARLDPRIFQ